MKKALVMLSVLLASTVFAESKLSPQEGMQKAKLDTAITEAKAALAANNCGVKLDFDYDWAGFEAIDFSAKNARKKSDTFQNEAQGIKKIAAGVNKICDNKTFKEVVAREKVAKILYKVTVDEKKTGVTATIANGAIEFTNNAFGGTRDGSDFFKAFAKEMKK